MLDLDARVDLDEIDFLPRDIVQEFCGSGVAIIDARRERDRCLLQFGAKPVGQRRRRGFLDQLLVAALDRTVALAEMHDIALAVAHHLHLDVARFGDEHFHEQGAVIERGEGFGAGAVEPGLDLVAIVGDDHPAPAAAGRGLEQHRIAEPIGLVAGVGRRLDLVASGNQRDPGRLGHRSRAQLVAQRVDRFAVGPGKGNAMLRAQRRQDRPLRQEAVARVKRVASGCLGRMHHQSRVEIALRRRPRPKHDGAVGQPRRGAVAVGIGHADHGLDIETLGRAHDAQGNFAAVGDEQSLHPHHPASIANNGWSAVTKSPSLARIATTVPAWPARTAVNNFITSTRHISLSASTRAPSST